MKIFEKYSGFIFDLDGTVYLEDELIEGAKETVNFLVNNLNPIIFVSNKTTGSRNDYFRFLFSKGLKIKEEMIITATEVVIDFLKKNYSKSKIFAIAEEKFISSLKAQGLHFSEKIDEIEIVIVTLDRTLNFTKLEIASESLKKGAKFFAANIDNTCPVKNGEIIDAGSIIASLEKSSNKKLELNLGKPSTFMINTIKGKLNDSLNNYLLVGDRLETDIKMANIAGIDSALVLTGVTKFNNGISAKPTYELQNISEIISEEI